MFIDIFIDYVILVKIIIFIMKSTREKVLHTLVTNPRSTIVQIADNVGINAISVRHHLTNLQANGFVIAEEERHGVGRPRLVYYLTESGQENFPKRYFRLSNHLLVQMKKSLSEEDLKNIFKNMADDITSEYEHTLLNMEITERLHLLERIMAEEGYDIRIEKTNRGYEINEVSCPYYQLGKAHPEICLFDKKLIANILAIPEDAITRVKHGDNHCSFKIRDTVE